jgi:hypothetical protein
MTNVLVELGKHPGTMYPIEEVFYIWKWVLVSGGD